MKVGTEVMCNGHKGTVVRVCEWDRDGELVEVRLERGTVCVSKHELIEMKG